MVDLAEAQSAENLLDVILGGNWYQQWKPVEMCVSLVVTVNPAPWVSVTDEILLQALLDICFGPYLSFWLQINIRLKKLKDWLDQIGLSGAKDGCCNKQRGTIILAESAASPNRILMVVWLWPPISLDQSCTDLEVRVWVSDQSDLKSVYDRNCPYSQDEPIISQEV